jgi:2-polyprenyl-6-hydroxyphenyl methylase/3-demethylubiquinone-9 3-methyltransferase
VNFSSGIRDHGSVDPREIAKFERMAADWWDPDGSLRPLHKLNPVRLAYIRDRAAAHFGREPRRPKPLGGLRIIDVGCGGGLLCEPLTRLGAAMLGIDPAPANIEVARLHAQQSGLSVDYRSATAEDVAAAGERFDVVLAMEVVEHVSDRDGFVRACADLLVPGGLFFAATINRTAKAHALAIVLAERVLRWLPRGTHDYEKLVRPEELDASLRAAGLVPLHRTGVSYHPLADSWRESADLDVNYMLVAQKPGSP